MENVESNSHHDVSLDFWVVEDFSNLKEECLENQLEAIFGSFEAQQFLNPRIQDKRMKNIPVDISNKIGPIGALELWESLRYQSQQKLSQNPQANHTYCRKHNVIGNQHSVKNKVETYTQRLQLMHKIAQLNDVKSTKLIQKINLPQITDNWNGGSSFEKENSKLANIENHTDCKLPQIKPIPTERGGRNKNLNNCLQEQLFVDNRKLCNKHEIIMDNKPTSISFLSEKDVSFCGNFCERMKYKGVVASVGIANASHSYKYARNTYDQSETLPSGFKDKEWREDTAVSNPWQPLTMNAVIECVDAFPTRKQITCIR